MSESEDLVKIAVLEQRIIDFSNVVSKIDDAITKLSDVNTNITKMLAVHEERIEQCNKSDNLIIKMIDDLKHDNTKEHKEVTNRINELESKVDEFAKIRWIAAGVIAVIVFVAPLVTNYLTTLVHYPQINKIK
jgi:hypothetical protein